MSTFSKQFLSGSTNGRPIKVGATATPGTTIHTAHATDKDEVWMWAVNTSTTDAKTTIELGGVTDPDDLIELTIPAEDGLYVLTPGFIISGGLLVKVFADVTNVINVMGFVNRITP